MTVADELTRCVGRAIKARRLDLGMAQRELARRIGVGKTYVSDIECRPQGHHDPQAAQVRERAWVSHERPVARGRDDALSRCRRQESGE